MGKLRSFPQYVEISARVGGAKKFQGASFPHPYSSRTTLLRSTREKGVVYRVFPEHMVGRATYRLFNNLYLWKLAKGGGRKATVP